ncbi:hypothetical protein F0562_033027 [Nyssa sinensis]|uniref:Uncharacterized protein n=1 Tax=Nyssa sinensis TaxID=561372 RepID=A0A5J5ASP3_9ASTE|nr:hypothetical protein F0562_033027 [Nyssa sinensis]
MFHFLDLEIPVIPYWGFRNLNDEILSASPEGPCRVALRRIDTQQARDSGHLNGKRQGLVLLFGKLQAVSKSFARIIKGGEEYIS